MEKCSRIYIFKSFNVEKFFLYFNTNNNKNYQKATSAVFLITRKKRNGNESKREKIFLFPHHIFTFILILFKKIARVFP